MYLTEKEIYSQYEALRKTYDYLLANAQQIRDVVAKHRPKSFTFIGCGSGYCLCRSGETSTKIRLGISANALAAGDMLINFEHYKTMLEDTLLIAPSRSGGTSEVIMAVQKAKAIGVPVIGISSQDDAPLSELAELSLEIPWAFDKSVCQTRTVTNLYVVNLLLIGIIANDSSLIAEIDAAITNGNAFMEQNAYLVRQVAKGDWDNAIILADSELDGIASEAAIAFVEIPQIPANYYHVLDVRHGPMVLINEKTLVIAALSSADYDLQHALIQDLKRKNARVVTVSHSNQKPWGADWEVEIPSYKNFGVVGIPFIFLPQAIGFYKALEKGLNPDLPAGLEPMIDLSK